jgi:HEAT repeat protein
MKWRITACLGLVVGLAILGLAFTDARPIVLGRLRGEAMYRGRPTAYWAAGLSGKEGLWGRPGAGGDSGRQLREGGTEAVPVLTEMLASSEGRVRYEALQSLAQMSPDPAPLVPAVTTLVKRQTGQEVVLAVDLLAKDRPAAVEALRVGLRENPDPASRALLAATLAQFLPEARSATDDLKSAQASDSPEVRLAAARVLYRLDGNKGIPLAARKRQDDTENARPAMRPPGRAKAPEGAENLLVKLRSAEVGARREAVKGMWWQGEANVPAVPALAEALKDSDVDVRRGAASALVGVGEKAAPALPALVGGLKDPDAMVRRRCAMVLGEIGPAANDAVPALVETLHDSDAEACARAAVALSRMGPAAREAVPAMADALKTRDRSARQRIALALVEVDADGRRTQDLVAGLVDLVLYQQIAEEAPLAEEEQIKAARALQRLDRKRASEIGADQLLKKPEGRGGAARSG